MAGLMILRLVLNVPSYLVYKALKTGPRASYILDKHSTN